MADIQLILEVIGEQDMVKAIKTADRMKAEYKKLDSTLNKNKMSAQQYAKGVQQLDAKYESLTKTTNRLTAATKQSAAAQALAGKRINRMGASLQQVGYQVGDFAVQVQGGTNVMVALGQQGAQLLGIFGAGGALAGAALAIGTALIAPLMRGEKAAKGLTDKIKELREELSDLQGKEVIPEEAVTLLREQEDLHLKILKAEDAVAAAKTIQSDKIKDGVRDQQSLLNAAAEVLSKEDALRVLTTQRAANSKIILDYQTALSAKKKQLFLDEKDDLSRQVAMLSMIKMYGEDSLAVKRLEKQQALEVYEIELKRGEYTQKQIDELVKMQAVALGLKDEVAGAAESGKDLATALREAASAMSSLLNTGSLEAKLAGLVAETNAIKTGADSASASLLASELSKARAQRDAALSGGNLPAKAVNQAYQDRVGIVNQVASATTARNAARDAAREKSKGGGSKKSPSEELQEYLDKLQQQSELESKLVGLFGEKRNTEEEVIKARQKYGEVFGASQEAELRGTLAQIEADKERQRVLEEAKQQQEDIASMIASNFGDAFMSIVDGTKSVKDAFKDMARAIIKELYQIFVIKKITGFIEGAIGGFSGTPVPSANGNVFSNGSLQAFANGGVVGGPTTFPMSGGKTGLMGEAGPEAIMPLKRGANGKLGVQMEGGSQGNVVVNQSFNFSANGDDSVKKLIAQAAPQIANMTQKQIMDSRRRGGAMKSTFG